MCGIAGRIDQTPPADAVEQVARMTAVLTHRGPDDHGVWRSPDGTATLGHRRLAIVDLSPLGHNPMLRAGGRLAITYNGEVYNFLELRRELESRGHSFCSHTDTEVILAAYDEWDTSCVSRFAGMFAFALWDERRRRMWVVRDRFGKKPLYYWRRGGSVAFASELKAFLTDSRFSRAVDPDALRMYLRYGYVPGPLSIFREARKLSPGHYMLWENGRLSIERYWNPVPAPGACRDELDDASAEAELETLLGTAVSQRCIADVPLGAFLSGGIDSSLIVALMAEQSSVPVQTHTIRFSNPEFNEADHAAAIARHLATEHHETTCDDAQMLAIVERLPAMYDEPFADSSAIPTHLVSRAARTTVTVALSGDGGDELFYGYPRYQYATKAGWIGRMPAWVRTLGAAVARRGPTRRSRRIADVLQDHGGDDYSRFVSWFDARQIRETTGQEPALAPLYAEMLDRLAALPPVSRAPMLDTVSYLPDDILAKVDRASMAISLEVRAPLLDHRVAEFAMSLPPRFKLRGSETKWLLRRLLIKRVPRELIDRPKMGFGVPLAAWFRGPLRGPMDQYCESRAFEALGLNAEPLRRMWKEFKAGVHHRPDLLWQVFSLAAWSRAFISQPI
jgi:asparagine synthase (glutamine-hydrolysing)